MSLLVEPMQPGDWDSVRAIYQEGIDTRNATFARSAPEWQEWNEKHLGSCRLVGRCEGLVLGWAALSPVSQRDVYRGVAEVSIYVAQNARGKGVGRALLSRLVEESEDEGIWTLQAGIFPENAASIELHKRVGFRVVGVREKLGCMDGCWRDVVLMERRSGRIGR
ncbi:MAG: N-acetyltransferase [Terriglobia bacterium]|nr:MAG: N-acetyltransferase [Terriglobia bacterium]